MSDYLYEGETIKLNAKDFNKFLIDYPALDLVATLNQLDNELRGTKKWWGTMCAKLRIANDYAARNQRYNRSQGVSDELYNPGQYHPGGKRIN